MCGGGWWWRISCLFGISKEWGDRQTEVGRGKKERRLRKKERDVKQVAIHCLYCTLFQCNEL